MSQVFKVCYNIGASCASIDIVSYVIELATLIITSNVIFAIFALGKATYQVAKFSKRLADNM